MIFLCPTCKKEPVPTPPTSTWCRCPCDRFGCEFDQNGNINQCDLIQGNFYLRSWFRDQSSTLYKGGYVVLKLNYAPLISSQEGLELIIERLLKLKSFS